MGNFTSTPKQEEINDTKNEQLELNVQPNKNLEKIMPKEEDGDTTDILESLDITELKPVQVGQVGQVGQVEQVGGKKNIPLLGGFDVNLSQTSDDIYRGLENKTGRKRYTKYDLFKILKDLDVETETQQRGGRGVGVRGGVRGGGEENVDSEAKSSTNDEQSMEHIKNIILKELETLKTNKSQQLGGTGTGLGCACDNGTKTGGKKNKNARKLSSKLNLNNVVIEDDSLYGENKQSGGTIIIDASSSSTTSDDSESSSSELGKSNKTKSKKTKSSKKSKINKRQVSDDSDSHFHIDTSESGLSNGSGKSEESDESEKSDESDGSEQTSNGENDGKTKKDETDSEEGLSIFPFNSSDVKSSVSIKNYRMLRRKI